MPVNKGNSRIDKGIRLSGSWQELDLIVSCLFVTGTFLGTKPMSRTVQTLPSARVEKRDPNTSQKMAFLAVEIVQEPSYRYYLPKGIGGTTFWPFYIPEMPPPSGILSNSRTPLTCWVCPV